MMKMHKTRFSGRSARTSLSEVTVVRHSEEIRWGRLKMRDLMLKYNGIWTQAQKAWVQIAAATPSGNSLRQTVHIHRASVKALKPHNYSSEMRRFELGAWDRQADRQTNRSIAFNASPCERGITALNVVVTATN